MLDTNIVLDLFVYQDPATAALREQLAQPGTRWLSTAAMREELDRVLGYPQIVKGLKARDIPAQAVLAQFDRQAEIVATALKAPYTCKDPDDQRFIDLAVAHQAVLVSKDAEVLCMARRLDRLGVVVQRIWAPA
ncbi:putative toxin-antitoxin system toxin component, PIN family [Hydrogenophaga sp. PAMC20947]|nr:putative toxin-antitoxin system toxin component, PIN family [Hydrogenophaga sp. PAMC20947]